MRHHAVKYATGRRHENTMVDLSLEGRATAKLAASMALVIVHANRAALLSQVMGQATEDETRLALSAYLAQVSEHTEELLRILEKEME